MKMTSVLVRWMEPVSLRSAWLSQAGLQAGQRVAHVALDFGTGRERRHRVDHDQIDRTGADQGVADFQRLLAGVRLGDEQLGQFDAQLGRILDIERVLGIDEGTGTTELLHFGNDLQRERGLARRLGAVDFDHPATWQAADAQGDVEPQRTGRHDLEVGRDLAIGHAHDRALAELLFDLCECGRQRLGLVCAGFFVHGYTCLR